MNMKENIFLKKLQKKINHVNQQNYLFSSADCFRLTNLLPNKCLDKVLFNKKK